MKLSVIIPVYCVEDTLSRCVESVLRQNVGDMEVILVDDGSPDSCGAICDEWREKDCRISVVHKQNGGLSSARNAGLDAATGQMVTFVDSDDWLDDDTYSQLLETMDDADILEYSVADRLRLEDAIFRNPEDYWIGSKAYAHTYAWNKIYRRELFNDVRYPEGRIFEDVYTLPLLLRNINKVKTTGRGYYHYTANNRGITATAGAKGLAMLLDAHLKSNMPVDDEYYMYLVNIQMDVWELSGTPVILPVRKVNTGSLNFKNKLKAIMLNNIGINKLCRLNKILHRVRKPSR
mgnify:CR=1 FL=1